MKGSTPEEFVTINAVFAFLAAYEKVQAIMEKLAES